MEKKQTDTSSLEGKARLAELNTEATKIKTEIITLEAEILKLDPSSKKEKVNSYCYSSCYY